MAYKRNPTLTVEQLILSKGLSFTETNANTWLIANKYYITAGGRWRKKGSFKWYYSGGGSKLEALLNKLFPEANAV
jgi:hypothetical protein